MPYGASRCVDRHAALCSKARAPSGALTYRDLPSHIADGDGVIPGRNTTASPRQHHDFLSKSLAATDLKAVLALCHYPHCPHSFNTQPHARDVLQLPPVVTEGGRHRGHRRPPNAPSRQQRQPRPVVRSEFLSAGTFIVGSPLPAMVDLLDAGGAVSSPRTAAPEEDLRSRLTRLRQWRSRPYLRFAPTVVGQHARNDGSHRPRRRAGSIASLMDAGFH